MKSWGDFVEGFHRGYKRSKPMPLWQCFFLGIIFGALVGYLIHKGFL
jgi:hypothetical protein